MPPDQITASAPPLPFPRLQRINPSPDVQQQVASAIEACTKWQPQFVQVGKDDAPPAEFTTEAQVCEVLDHWPLIHNGEELHVISLGVVLALATAGACALGWVVFYGTRGIVPLAPPTFRLMVRAVGGALCAVGLATLFFLLSLDKFAAAATLEEIAGKAFLFWLGAVLWAFATFAVLFVLFAVPDFLRRRKSPAAKG